MGEGREGAWGTPSLKLTCRQVRIERSDAAVPCKRAQELWSPEPGECVWQNTTRMQPLG